MGLANEITVEQRGPVALFDIKGDITRDSGLPFDRAYNDTDHKVARKILLKFRESTYFNSEGLKVIIDLLSKAKKNNQEVGITGLSAHFDKIFGMVGIAKLAHLFDSEADALTQWRTSPKGGRP